MKRRLFATVATLERRREAQVLSYVFNPLYLTTFFVSERFKLAGRRVAGIISVRLQSKPLQQRKAML